MMTKAHILREIKRTAQANGGVPLGSKRFATETGIGEPDWKGKLWARWGDAVREAGLAPNRLTQPYGEEELLDKYAELCLELRRLPAPADIKLSVRNGMRFPDWGTFRERFGGKPELISRLLIHCESRREYADVITLCKAYAPARTNKQVDGERSSEEVGFVYLAKSGRFYKIGRSNSAGRREYELAIQLPEKVQVVHQICTDDPAGIETYWHRRFEAKHKNGEWFDLDGADVRAFKRRKFM